MRKNISKLASLTLVALLTISALAVFAPSVKAVTPTMEIINPLDGTHDFNFTSTTKSVGDTFVVNITAVNVENLKNFQFNVTWDGTLLSYVSVVRPADNVFALSGYDIIGVPVILGGSSVVWGYTYINDNPYHWTFNGTGTLAQLTLRIIAGVSQGGPTQVNCNIQLANIPADTFMIASLHGQGDQGSDLETDIAFSAVNGRYFYKWVAPAFNPTMYIKPAVEKPDKINDIFALQVWVRDVAAGWEIIGFQFALMWNTTFITPALGPGGKYYDNGTFLEAFQYYADGVQYVSDVNKPGNNLPPPFHLQSLPTGYNWSEFGALLLPDADPNQYHAPFPSVGPDGALLMTVYFQAIYETISPVEDWTWIEFIRLADGRGVPGFTYALNKYINIINVGTEDCHYRAPMKILGLGIDLYTQYSPPYGGQGANMPSDMFGPQQLVDLFALVTYNEYPVQQKLVGFHIRHNGYDIYREGTTDSRGIAHVTFRLPWPCVDPVNEIFGKWFVIATVEVAEQVKNDTLAFWVWWKVWVMSVEPKQTEYVQGKPDRTPMDFTLLYGTYSMQTIIANITVTVYDELGFFIGSELLSTTVGWGEYKYYDYMICEPAPFKQYPAWEPVIPMPTNAVVGLAQVFGNAYDNLPWNGGTPYCPEVTNTIDFYIVKPGP